MKLPSTIVNILLALSGNTNLMTLWSYGKCLNEYILIQNMQCRYTMNVSISLLTLNETLCCPSFISILCCSIAIKICSAFAKALTAENMLFPCKIILLYYVFISFSTLWFDAERKSNLLSNIGHFSYCINIWWRIFF